MSTASNRPHTRFCPRELARYILNGLFATAIHYGVLSFNVKVIHMSSVAAASMIAACFGIIASFIGSRHFVFKKNKTSITLQASKFALAYAIIACLHGIVLFVWSDIYHFNYNIGFLIATVLQVMLSYVSNKLVVFKI